jgi:hypothetical protein
LLRRLSRTSPIVVVIDDLQWADAASLELLHFIASDLADERIMIGATYRTADPPVNDHVDELLAELARHRSVRRIELDGLDSSSLSDLLATFDRRPSVDTVQELHHRTRGNPFFVMETLRLIESSNRTVDADTVRRVVPASVRGVIRRRVARLPPDTVTALSAASVLGADFDLALAATLAGVDPDVMLAQIETATQSGLLTDSPTGVGRFRYSHGLVQETLYADMGPAQRADLHRRAGEALEQRHGSSSGAHLLALAEHWYHAVPAAPPTKGIDYARKAAFWALGRIDHRQAEQQLRTALELIASLPAGTERSQLELDVLDQQVLLAASALTTYTPQELVASTARTRELCAELGEQSRLVTALWRIAMFHLMRGAIDAAVSVGDELLTIGTTTGEVDAQLVGHMCVAVMLMHRGDLVDARRHFDIALASGDAGQVVSTGTLVEDPAVFCRAFSAIDHWLLGDDAAAEADVARALAVAGEHGANSHPMTIALWAASMIAVLRRDVHEAQRRCADGAAHALTNGFPLGGHVQGALGGWAIAAGGDVDRGLSEIVDHADAHGAVRPYMRPWFLTLHADACVIGERFDEALRSIDSALTIAGTTGESWCGAELHRLRAEARAGIDPADTRIVEDLHEARQIASAHGAIAWLRRAEAGVDARARPVS